MRRCGGADLIEAVLFHLTPAQLAAEDPDKWAPVALPLPPPLYQKPHSHLLLLLLLFCPLVPWDFGVFERLLEAAASLVSCADLVAPLRSALARQLLLNLRLWGHGGSVELQARAIQAMRRFARAQPLLFRRLVGGKRAKNRKRAGQAVVFFSSQRSGHMHESRGKNN